MLQNKILKVGTTNWLVRLAIDENAALDCIANARASGSVSSSLRVNDALHADVHRLTDDGFECLAYGERGADYSHLLVEPASDATFPCDWNQLRQVAADFLRAIPSADEQALEAGGNCFNLHYLGFQSSSALETHQSVLLFDIVNKAWIKAQMEQRIPK